MMIIMHSSGRASALKMAATLQKPFEIILTAEVHHDCRRAYSTQSLVLQRSILQTALLKGAAAAITCITLHLATGPNTTANLTNCMQDIGATKPDPRVFHVALETLKREYDVQQKDVLHVVQVLLRSTTEIRK